jgi:hypothetical protein
MFVYYEQFYEINEAILRKKRIKKWNREWKVRLIDEFNPNLNDLYDSILCLDSREDGDDNLKRGVRLKPDPSLVLFEIFRIECCYGSS